MVRKGLVIQSATTLLLAIMNFSTGYCVVWPSYTLRYFEDNPDRLGGTYQPHHGDLVGSLSMLGSFIAIMFSGLIADLIGRKKAEMICGFCFLLSGALACIATNVHIILVSRFILGLAIGLQKCVHNLFISEYTEDSNRGTITAAVICAYTSGILVSYIMGWLCSYDVVNYFIMTLALVFLVGMLFWKETPTHLLMNGKNEEALKSLKFYRGTKHTSRAILTELSSIKNLSQPPEEMVNLTEKQYEQIANSGKETLKKELEEVFKTKPKANAWKALYNSKTSQRGLVISTVLLQLMVFTGMVPVQTYAGQLFLRAVPTLSPDMCSVVLAIANMLGCGCPVLLNNYLGRRSLMTTSCILVSTCLFTIGALLRWSFAPDWVIPAVMLVFCFCFQLGIGCVPTTFTSECFLPEVKSLCNTIALSVMEVGNFFLLVVFRPTVDIIGLDATFFLFGSFALITTCISYICLPETSGQSAEAIQALLSKGYVQIRKPKSSEKSVSGI